MLLCFSAFMLLTLRCEGANILAVVLHTAYSHQIAFRPLWKELSLRGHKVTLLTTDPMNNATLTNITEIDLSIGYNVWTSTDIIEYSEKHNMFTVLNKIIEIGGDVIDAEMSVPGVQKLLQEEGRHFDLVIAEPYYPFAMAFSEKFDCPLIVAFSMDGMAILNDLAGNFAHLLLSPTHLLPFDNPFTLPERIITVLSFFVEKIVGVFYEEGFNQIARKYFGADLPSLVRIMDERLCLCMFYINPAFGNIRPLSPATLTLGGGTIMEQPKPLPDDLKAFLDNATEGAVYFSLGSNAFSKTMLSERKQAIEQALAELPFKVLWKFEATQLRDIPNNIKVAKWVPQQDVLRHPNVKAFVTQGGLQSIEEALCAHVPLVVMPKIADQFLNAKRVVRRGMGLKVDFATVTTTKLKEVIVEVASNPKFRNRVKELDEFAKDQPIEPLEKAVWWVEYVIRHNGTKHLRGSFSGKPFYEHMFQPDVLLVFAIALLLLPYFLLKAIQLLMIMLSFKMREDKTILTKKHIGMFLGLICLASATYNTCNLP